MSLAAITPTLSVGAKIPNEKKNEVHRITNYVSDLLPLQRLPIFETYNPANGDKIHYVSNTELQKLIEKYHRYGPKTAPDPAKCPFSPGAIRSRFTHIIPKPNPLTLNDPESVRYRESITTFFNKNLRALTPIWEEIIDQWIAGITMAEEVPLFESVSRLVVKITLVGILGYTICEEKEADIDRLFWKKLFAPMPSELKTLDEVESASTLEKVYEMLRKMKLVFVDWHSLNRLVNKIIDFGLSPEGRKRPNFPAYLEDSGFDRDSIEGLCWTMLVGAQENTQATLAFTLYEYAKNQGMQQQHAAELDRLKANELKDMGVGCYRAYLETLRHYATAGALREAREDMVITYSDGKEHYIRKGDFINAVPYTAGHNPDTWEEPETFNPDRESLAGVKKSILPFGSGPHACPGKKGAEEEILLSLYHILRKAQIELKDGSLSPLIQSTVLRPVQDIRVAFNKREG